MFWRVVRSSYETNAALLSLIVFCLYPLHIAYSTTSSSESVYLLFVLLGLLAFLRHHPNGSYRTLMLSGGAFSCAEAIRYEAWVLMFAVGLVLVVSEFSQIRNRRTLVGWMAFGITGGAWPAFWVVYNWLNYRSPLYAVTKNYTWVAEQVASRGSNLGYRLMLMPGVLLLTLTPLVLLAAFIAVWTTSRNTAGHKLVIVLVIFAIVQGFQVAAGGQMPFARYTLTLGTLMAMICGQGLVHLWRFLTQRPVKVLMIACIALLFANDLAILALSESHTRYSDKFASVSPRLRFVRRVQEIGAALRARVTPGERVVIDNYNDEANIIAFEAGMGVVPGDQAYMVREHQPAEVLAYIHTSHPQWLVYSKSGLLPPLLGLSAAAGSDATLSGIAFHLVFNNSVYALYEIRYPTTPY
jgi:hypothetical protein